MWLGFGCCSGGVGDALGTSLSRGSGEFCARLKNEVGYCTAIEVDDDVLLAQEFLKK